MHGEPKINREGGKHESYKVVNVKWTFDHH